MNKVLPQICEKALQQNANVHKVHEFLLELTSPTFLLLGQKHYLLMIDKRTEVELYNLKTNFSDPGLVLEIFKLGPKVQNQISTKIS